MNNSEEGSFVESNSDDDCKVFSVAFCKAARPIERVDPEGKLILVELILEARIFKSSAHI